MRGRGAAAEQIRREAESRPQDRPKVNLQGIEELVTDKGYHSSAVVQRMKSYQVRSYIPEKKPKGRRDWQGQHAEQQAVYENRRRVRGEYGKSLLRRRGELIERSFAHCYETGGMRRNVASRLSRLAPIKRRCSSSSLVKACTSLMDDIAHCTSE